MVKEVKVMEEEVEGMVEEVKGKEEKVMGIEEEDCVSRIPESTTYVPVMVTNNSYEVYKQRNKNLIRQAINVRFSNQDNING